MSKNESNLTESATLLSLEQRHRLVQLLDEYLISVERGDPIDPAELGRRHLPAQANR